jgi:CPA2 family monovalent cation:H+ antiporter-2
VCRFSAATRQPWIDHSSKQIDMIAKFGFRALLWRRHAASDLLHSAGITDDANIFVAIDGKEQITELVKYVSHPSTRARHCARGGS